MPYVEYDGPTQWAHLDDTLCEGEVSEEIPGQGICLDHDRRVKRVPAPQSNVLIEILHTRDPDSGCEHTVFLNGVRYDQGVNLYIEDIDPGAGYTPDTWEERIKEARDNDAWSPTPEFRELVIRTLEANKNSKYNLDW